MVTRNLLQHLPLAGKEEIFEEILRRPGVRLERIISDGQTSPPGFWYEQGYDEWVILLQGEARLEYADGQLIDINVGDSLLIPAGCRHRVVYTASRTIWLALHCE